MKYPGNNIFNSPEWKNRTTALNLITPAFTIQSLYSLNLALLRSGLWSDYEEWPTHPVPSIQTHTSPDAQADWVVYRKLLAEPTRLEKVKKHGQSLPFFKRPFVTPYSISPYLDLTKPLCPQKKPIADIYRLERKLTREIAAPLLCESTTTNERAQWFETYVHFQSARHRISNEQTEILKTWILAGAKPAWMRLFTLMIGNTPVATGLFYDLDGVFYYFSSAMTPDLKYRKYGPGKLFVEKLIQYAISSGATTFDFLQGAHEYKSHWNPENRVLYQCIYPNSVKGFGALTLFKIKKFLFNKKKRSTLTMLPERRRHFE